MKNNKFADVEAFAQLDIRIGTILEAHHFEAAKKPAYILHIHFGELGTLKSSAQITQRYQPADLIGMQVVAVVNFPPKQIANIKSQCLVLGAVDATDVILLQPHSPVKDGTPIA